MLVLLVSLLSTFDSCKKENKEGLSNCEPYPTFCYKGRLEVKGMCGNYTISVIEGNISPSLIQASWKDPRTNKTYKNVFGLQNICDFPSSLQEGDTFYFSIKNSFNNNCITCAGYYPTPEKVLPISVSSKPCNSSTN